MAQFLDDVRSSVDFSSTRSGTSLDNHTAAGGQQRPELFALARGRAVVVGMARLAVRMAVAWVVIVIGLGKFSHDSTSSCKGRACVEYSFRAAQETNAHQVR